jgi:hypothetical protein
MSSLTGFKIEGYNCYTSLGGSKALVIRGASKLKLKEVNEMRTVTVRRVIIVLNISRHPLLI